MRQKPFQIKLNANAVKPYLPNFVLDSTSSQHMCYLCSVKIVFKDKAFDVWGGVAQVVVDYAAIFSFS